MELKATREAEINQSGRQKLFDIFTNHHTPKVRNLTGPHTHSYIEILMCAEGSLIDHYHVDGPLEIHSGDIYFTPPETIHDLTSLDSGVSYCSHVVKFSTKFLYPLTATASDISELISFDKFPKQSVLFPAGTKEAEELAPLIRRIINEKEQHKPGWELGLRGEITLLYLQIVRYFSTVTEEPASEPMSLALDNDSTFHIQQVFDYLEENYQYNISMNEVAELCKMSYSQFSRFFSAMTGTSFTKYLTDLRLSKAQKMILMGEKSISEIAMLCGFDYLSYFDHVFKKVFGESPGEFQARYRRKD